METIYLICLLVGGFFVALSLLGGDHAGDHGDIGDVGGGDADAGFHFDTSDLHIPTAGPGLVDLLSLRALFLFAAFFGLTGTALSLIDSGEPFTAIVAVLVGLIVGLGGNYVIRRMAFDRVSSDLRADDLTGMTGRVLLPFQGDRKGKISVVAGGQRLQLVARGFEGQASHETFQSGDEVVVVRMDGAIAEVIKPE